jgi:hypothetical protein
MWNHTSFPAYKSRLWDMQGQEEKSGAEKRKPYVYYSFPSSSFLLFAMIRIHWS